MRRSTLPLLAAALVSSSLHAQQPVVALATPVSQGCPVSLDARHAQVGALLATDHRSEAAHPEQSFRLTFLPQDERAIVQARVRLHGLAGGTLLPAGMSGIEGRAHEDFTLTPTRAAARRFSAVLYAEKLTGVQWIEVQSLRYADGTTWKASSDSLCRVAPNGYMEVAATR